ncbi:sulfatase [Brachyspira innocens]|uniref:Sulfatase n=1 Tax=Brachyspira innocens TaxID=13264 RepID=A0ABT8YUP9_9SPIR|nr:sulfatase [Brachyspira innocens]MDO6993076.1 sulfatase [Brachyspira innocens]MDO7019613.1 sulfatase [Brachyspira innocens]
MKYNTLKNNSFLIISLILIIIMYYLITQLIFPMFSVNKMNFSIIDIIYVYVFSIISYILSNKNKLTSYFFIIVAVFSFFTIEPLGMTIEAKPLFFTDMPDMYPSLIEVLPLYMQIITITATTLYFGLLLAYALYFIYGLYKMYKTNIKKAVVMTIVVIFVTYISFFRPVKINSIYADYNDIANKYGIINTISYRISYDKSVEARDNKESVKEALKLLTDIQNKRDISNLILPYDTDKKRNVFVIFMESFYDYEHFLPLIDKDPFPKEYREWASNSTRVGPNDSYGSLFARTSGLIASSPLFPKKQKTPIYTALPYIMKDNGYHTIALEESGVTYYLDALLPNIGMEEVVFSLGLTNIKNYIKTNNYDKPIFLAGFTFMGHAGSHVENDLNVYDNNKRLMDKISKKDIPVLIETMENSALAAKDIIDTRDTILEKYPDAIIIFKHDHLYPYLKTIIENSSIDNNIKEDFFNDNTISPMLIWNGTNGAYRFEEDGFPPENIPMFVAVNTKANYTNSIISLLYKDKIDNIIRYYNAFYTNDNGSIKKIEVKKDSTSYIVNHAQKILSEDILRGKKYIYTYINNDK